MNRPIGPDIPPIPGEMKVLTAIIFTLTVAVVGCFIYDRRLDHFEFNECVKRDGDWGHHGSCKGAIGDVK